MVAGRFALLGLTHTLALEGRKYAIEVNVITNQSKEDLQLTSNS